MEIGIIAAGAGTSDTFPLNYLPEELTWIIDVTPSQLKVTVSGFGIICDLDAAGLDELRNRQQIGLVTNGYKIPLADGRLDNVNVRIAMTNESVGTALALNARSEMKARGFVISEQVAVFANQALDVKDFFYLGMPTLAAADTLTLDYRNQVDPVTNQVIQFAEQGDEMNRDEVSFRLQKTQQEVNGIYSLDNFDTRIGRVRAIVGTDQTFYKQRYATVSPVDSSAQA